MRELKFRVWHPNQKKFLYFDDFRLWYEDSYTLSSALPDVDFVDFYQSEIIIQQFTGLKDKNGVEIYEGDILKITWTQPKLNGKFIKLAGVNNPRETVQQICEVIFENGCFNCKPYSCLHNLFYCVVKNSEVIGNVSENPELETDSKYKIIGDAPDIYI